MGSISEIMECPRCKSDCHNEYYYKTGEEYINCSECGYCKIFHYKRDEKGEYLKKDESKEQTIDNLIPEEINLEDPFGSYTIDFEKNSQIGVLVTEEDYQTFVSEIVSLINQPKDFKKVVVSRFVDDKIKKEIIYSE